ncbi:MAG TPA: hypothetical protein VGK29_03910 [Paludibaculum sp.]|jgi:hypothetical protein
MDLRGYYLKLQEMESGIAAQDVYIVSLATPDGGVAGVLTQAPRRVACQLVVEGKARMATKAEAAAFESEERVRREALAEEEYNRRIHVHVVTGADPGKRGKKG